MRSVPIAGTFHGVAHRLLRLYAPRIGLDPAFTFLDAADAADLLDVCREARGLARSASRFPQKATCLAIYSHTVNADRPLAETLAHAFPWCDGRAAELRALFADYVDAKQARHVLDYDDLLLVWCHLMRDPALAAHVKGVLCVPRWAENPRDTIAAFRVLPLLPGIGPGQARRASARTTWCCRPSTRRKVREWDVVYVLNVADGCIPSDMACGRAENVVEERRLLYVAMTRARTRLHLVQPLRFFVRQQRRDGDRHVYAPRSRFLPDDVLPCFARVAHGRPHPPDPEGARPAPAPLDVGAQLRARWR